MDKIGLDVIDRLFTCMQQFFGSRWDIIFRGDSNKQLVRTIWQTSLQGLTEDQIRTALKLVKANLAQFPNSYPPTPMEFYRIARPVLKKLPEPPVIGGPSNDSEIAKKFLNDMRQKLSRKIVNSN